MIISNQEQAVNIRIQNSIGLLVLVITIGLIYFANILPNNTLGFNKNQIAIFIITTLTGYFILNYLRNHNYIYFSDTGDKFILRYYSLRPFEDKKNAIEFHKREFHKYELRQSMFRFRERVVIYRKTSKGIAKYPPVSITALGKLNREKLLASFKKLIMENQIIR